MLNRDVDREENDNSGRKENRNMEKVVTLTNIATIANFAAI